MNSLKERVEIQKLFSVEDCKNNPYKLYIFGDNLLSTGTGGQATIRHCYNAFGVPTKRFPTMESNAFFSDKEEEKERLQWTLDMLLNIYLKRDNITIVFPKDGLGTGLAKMSIKSPKLYKLMNDFIYENFGVKYV